MLSADYDHTALFCQEAFDTCTTGSEEIGQERCKAN